MARYKRFTFLCDSKERRILADLAQHLERSQSDSVRLLIRNAAAELAAEAVQPVKLVQPVQEGCRERS